MNLRIIKDKVKARTFGITETNMKGSGLMTKNMVKGLLPGLMETNMKGSGLKVKKREEENLL